MSGSSKAAFLTCANIRAQSSTCLPSRLSTTVSRGSPLTFHAVIQDSVHFLLPFPVLIKPHLRSFQTTHLNLHYTHLSTMLVPSLPPCRTPSSWDHQLTVFNKSSILHLDLTIRVLNVGEKVK